MVAAGLALQTTVWPLTGLPRQIAFHRVHDQPELCQRPRARREASVTNFAALDQPGIKVAAVNPTTTMRGAVAHLKNAKVTGYQTYDEIFGLLKSGEIDAFALSRDQLNKMAQKIPGTKVLGETFKKTVTAVAVPLGHQRALTFVTGFMNEAVTNGALRKAYDNNGLKDSPIRTE